MCQIEIPTWLSASGCAICRGLPGTAGALTLNFPFRHPAAVIIGIHFPLCKIPPFPSATVPPP